MANAHLQSESYIERKCVEIARNRRCWLLKFTCPGQRGVPDRMLLTPGGRVVFIEFKRGKGGRLSRIQQHVINRMRRSYRQDVHVIDSVSAFEYVLERTLALDGTHHPSPRPFDWLRSPARDELDAQLEVELQEQLSPGL